jgi:hypothetical protein
MQGYRSSGWALVARVTPRDESSGEWAMIRGLALTQRGG